MQQGHHDLYLQVVDGHGDVLRVALVEYPDLPVGGWPWHAMPVVVEQHSLILHNMSLNDSDTHISPTAPSLQQLRPFSKAGNIKHVSGEASITRLSYLAPRKA